ncbi:MAG: filamentous hemagglutinin N-terminal domain-containing protein [Planctomycetaceae bacterium]|nr:filamentous hemagglutinin N-terminal domain-containing protein [Planctomycetaceae bacterium]
MKKTNAYKTFLSFLWSGALVAASFQSSPLLAQTQTSLGLANSASSGVTLPGGVGGAAGAANIGVTQARSYINWNDFNINGNQTANFNFSGAGMNGVIVNHVTGGGATAIFGGLNAPNGHVFVVNPNGLTIGNTGAINAQSFTGSTLNLNSSQISGFLDGSRDSLDFTHTGNGAAVVNNGTITTTNGSATLMGSQVVNSGTITANNGNVNLLAGPQVTVLFNAPGNPHINVANPGYTINTTGGFLNVYALAINNTGTIRATSVVNENGCILLKSDGGTIRHSGKLIADGNPSNGKGGAIELNAGPTGQVEVIGNQYAKDSNNDPINRNAVISANGNNNGSDEAGTILVSAKNVKLENASVTALGTGNGDGITISAGGDINVTSSLLGTTDKNITMTSFGNIILNTSYRDFDTYDSSSTLVNAFNKGTVTLEAKSITLNSNNPGSYISVGSNKGTTYITTTEGDLVLNALNGGTAQIGYHFRDSDARLYDRIQTQDTIFDGLTWADLVIAGGSEWDGTTDHQLGNIQVQSKRDVILNAVYKSDYNNNDNVDFAPAAFIGNAVLVFNLSDVAKIGGQYQLGGNIVVRADRDVKTSGTGASVARIGHYVKDYVVETTPLNYEGRFLSGNITVDAWRDILIDSNSGGTSGIGHLGDVFQLVRHGSGFYYAINTTASRNTILTADGQRVNVINGNNTWHSVSQIGHNIAKQRVWVGDSKPIIGDMASGDIESNITSLSGANVWLTGINGGTSAIGHENNINPMSYKAVVNVGYAFNRYKDLTDDNVRNSLGSMYPQWVLLKNRFTGNEEGYLHVDGNSRIGQEFSAGTAPSTVFNYAYIYGYRMMKDGTTSAIRLDDGAILNGVYLTNQQAPGVYDADNFRYNLGPYPDPDHYGKYTDYEPIEHYGYIYADYLAGHFSDPAGHPSVVDVPGKNYASSHLQIFYPYVAKPVVPPPPPPPPHYRPEEPRYPIFPVWFESCNCCCIVTTCCAYVPKACEPAHKACEPAQATEGSGGDSNSEGVPTLAPPQETPSEVPAETPSNEATPTNAPAIPVPSLGPVSVS